MAVFKTYNIFPGDQVSDTIDSGETTIYSDRLPSFRPSDDALGGTLAVKATGGSGQITVTARYYHGDKVGYGPEHTVGTITIDGDVMEVDLYSNNNTRDWFGRLSENNEIQFKFVRSNSTGTTTITGVLHRK